MVSFEWLGQLTLLAILLLLFVLLLLSSLDIMKEGVGSILEERPRESGGRRRTVGDDTRSSVAVAEAEELSATPSRLRGDDCVDDVC